MKYRQPQQDALGRIYLHRPGPVRTEIVYEDDPELDNIAVSICDITDRAILRNHIANGIVIFKRSEGRRPSTMKPGYVHSLKNSIRSLTEQPWVYAIEVTDIFYNLTERARFEIMLNLLKRIPESEVANGKMITFNTFEGFSDDFEKITTSLNLT